MFLSHNVRSMAVNTVKCKSALLATKQIFLDDYTFYTCFKREQCYESKKKFCHSRFLFSNAFRSIRLTGGIRSSPSILKETITSAKRLTPLISSPRLSSTSLTASHHIYLYALFHGNQCLAHLHSGDGSLVRDVNSYALLWTGILYGQEMHTNWNCRHWIGQ